MTTDPEIHTLRNGSTFAVKCTYPDQNDPLVLEAIVDAMKHIGVFDGIFDEKRWKEREKETSQAFDWK